MSLSIRHTMPHMTFLLLLLRTHQKPSESNPKGSQTHSLYLPSTLFISSSLSCHRSLHSLSACSLRSPGFISTSFSGLNKLPQTNSPQHPLHKSHTSASRATFPSRSHRVNKRLPNQSQIFTIQLWSHTQSIRYLRK